MTDRVIDSTDAALLLALADYPRATAVALAETTGLARSTVHSRLNRLESEVLSDALRRVDPASVGLPLSAFIFAHVTQQKLSQLPESLALIPEVIEVFGVSGDWDLLIRVAAADADDLYRVADLVLSTPGIERTSTVLAMKHMVPYRTQPLIERVRAGTRSAEARLL
ncbi:Lrp/AsnC family transcriptional regulator [Microterricola pindariensis]|uniref:AsnC family transcriptional regulator n=1 Tax=Microterricola pindariensis TaxID=478010 RepID=A0ABX5AYJ9_9MICO|nr:Lrp/AsnC ligand binding domain-containing protein [Microterricola pindariensis]PPL19977.1 AsnC family transcriptional regulator [Microterricola pindariensis]